MKLVIVISVTVAIVLAYPHFTESKPSLEEALRDKLIQDAQYNETEIREIIQTVVKRVMGNINDEQLCEVLIRLNANKGVSIVTDIFAIVMEYETDSETVGELVKVMGKIFGDKLVKRVAGVCYD